MENTEALRIALHKLAAKRQGLSQTLEQQRGEIRELDIQLAALNAQREKLVGSIEESESAYNRVDQMMTQTEEGYQRMLETAQTLMDLVNLQMKEEGNDDDKGSLQQNA